MRDPIGWPTLAGSEAGIWTRYMLVAVVAILAAGLIHAALTFVLKRAAARTKTQADDIIIRRLRGPTRWVFAVSALMIAQPAMQLGPTGLEWWHFLAGLLTPALIGWLAIALLAAGNDIVQDRTDITVADNLRARRRRTRFGILYRIGFFVILVITICLMLMSIPAVRTVGVTLAASAGIGALAVGAAAQPALKNIIGGIQMAFSEPIRIDDVVIVDGEWGKIEEINLTFVVVRIWDDRRLVVPVAKFMEENFQNWTRRTSDLLGTTFLHVDRTADVPRLRRKLTEIVSNDPLWDGRVCGLQVTDSFPWHIELRCLMSAADAPRSFDLRCNVREAMTAYIAAEMPEAIPRQQDRIEFVGARAS
ncbi:mechanosensitive ion channel family protein [Sphingomonas abietis]|uniref:Mechanosensitive ion channel n=1 Tax=Sphingomonas abietis TaxID=3012344 RepID=A0ABY7NUI3_9SPHN|nr:mechanosensitive ion channel domain-containing protein [Sphingomonas abietis]WBO24217.1 mechanosensitive ion channel [Sphingomonas abietis]